MGIYSNANLDYLVLPRTALRAIYFSSWESYELTSLDSLVHYESETHELDQIRLGNIDN